MSEAQAIEIIELLGSIEFGLMFIFFCIVIITLNSFRGK